MPYSLDKSRIFTHFSLFRAESNNNRDSVEIPQKYKTIIYICAFPPRTLTVNFPTEVKIISLEKRGTNLFHLYFSLALCKMISEAKTTKLRPHFRIDGQYDHEINWLVDCCWPFYPVKREDEIFHFDTGTIDILCVIVVIHCGWSLFGMKVLRLKMDQGKFCRIPLSSCTLW